MTQIIRKVHVIGINSFEFNELPFKLQKLFIETENIAVPDSYFANIKLWAKNNAKNEKLFFASRSDNKLINWLKSQKSDVILFSRGDPLWFGIGRILIENFSKEELSFYPSNTCFQLAFSKLKISWQEAIYVSIHGRDSTKLIEVLKTKPLSLAIITDSKNNGLEIIQNNLLELNLENLYEFWICEEIGFKNEKIRKFNLKEKLPSDISNLNIAVLLRKEKDHVETDIPLFGLKDDTFKTFEDRPNLLTKREVRIQILADLELPENGTIWDIGAGCGSIGLEALKLRPNLKLFCIDKRIGSKELISENARRLGVSPKDIFEEDVNNLFNSNNINSLREAKRIIIGGCDKKTKLRIINELSIHMNCGDIVAIPLIDIQTIKDLRDTLKGNNFEVNLNLIQTYKSLSISEGIRMDPNNPVFLLRGRKLS
ncbi:putative precorrin-6y methylase [Prochlorococcus marinus subsp. pastoris str. CCMP1986]|uniref:Putative precorrin-6y methylase n=1 Tax=Prochlorococcus marinus subsp. pastoris (strain CCMP1986 / NIES-2087 / MED4) TaxID=59919 RepID=Q7V0I9_PROMP|nr:bifunctional cobalt-precorrin-7 (C(5))-methyltransferase/cobalt-precorrin-6B (C(15))-methyltransferase [Prochlorococcus marinus]CAE19727.1 putative precorrin-6y methylase [Prochlorococcus marinus subsp. pastoris str. CCMP1986]